MGVAGFYLITMDGDVGTGVVYVPPEVYLNACQPCGCLLYTSDAADDLLQV